MIKDPQELEVFNLQLQSFLDYDKQAVGKVRHLDDLGILFSRANTGTEVRQSQSLALKALSHLESPYRTDQNPNYVNSDPNPDIPVHSLVYECLDLIRNEVLSPESRLSPMVVGEPYFKEENNEVSLHIAGIPFYAKVRLAIDPNAKLPKDKGNLKAFKETQKLVLNLLKEKFPDFPVNQYINQNFSLQIDSIYLGNRQVNIPDVLVSSFQKALDILGIDSYIKLLKD